MIIAKQDIVHAASGLMLQYKSEYRPANKIVTLSAVIPMVADMCYLILMSAFKKIPRCNLTKNMANFIDREDRPTKKIAAMKRNKRFLTDIVSIGIGTAALTLSTANMIQTANLKNEIKTVTESLRTLQTTEYARKAQILQLTEGQLKLAMELNNTQQAINRTMLLVNQHSNIIRDHDEAIRTVGKFPVLINHELNEFMHTVEGRFLHTTIEDILRGKLNLITFHSSQGHTESYCIYNTSHKRFI